MQNVAYDLKLLKMLRNLPFLRSSLNNLKYSRGFNTKKESSSFSKFPNFGRNKTLYDSRLEKDR